MAVSYRLPDATATMTVGAALWNCVADDLVVHLQGDLGAGKTTLVRGLLRAAGYSGAARSPTYTLIEPYELSAVTVYHLDLYRLGDPEELEYLGLRDLLSTPYVMLVEWPDRGRGVLPPADLTLSLDYCPQGRILGLKASGVAGGRALECLRNRLQDFE